MSVDLVVRTPQGSLPVDGARIPRSQSDPITPGSIYELHGSISSWVMWAFPQSWVLDWLTRANAIDDPTGDNRFETIGSILNPDGTFVIQVRTAPADSGAYAQAGIPALYVVAAAVVVVLTILAGMTIERVVEVIPQVSPAVAAGVAQGVSGLFVIGAVALAGVFIFKKELL